MEQELEQLKRRVGELEQRLKSFNQAYSIPIEVDRAFKGRNFLKYLAVETVDPLDWDSLNKDFGGIPGLDFPVRWGKLDLEYINFKTPFYIPLYTLNEDPA